MKTNFASLVKTESMGIYQSWFTTGSTFSRLSSLFVLNSTFKKVEINVYYLFILTKKFSIDNIYRLMDIYGYMHVDHMVMIKTHVTRLK